MIRRPLVRVFAGLLGIGLLFGPVTTAQANTNGGAEQCRCLMSDTRDIAVPKEPPLTLPYEKPGGQVGSGIYGILSSS